VLFSRAWSAPDVGLAGEQIHKLKCLRAKTAKNADTQSKGSVSIAATGVLQDAVFLIRIKYPTVDECSCFRESPTRPASRTTDRDGVNPWAALP